MALLGCRPQAGTTQQWHLFFVRWFLCTLETLSILFSDKQCPVFSYTRMYQRSLFLKTFWPNCLQQLQGFLVSRKWWAIMRVTELLGPYLVSESFICYTICDMHLPNTSDKRCDNKLLCNNKISKSFIITFSLPTREKCNKSKCWKAWYVQNLSLWVPYYQYSVAFKSMGYAVYTCSVRYLKISKQVSNVATNGKKLLWHFHSL